MFIYLVLLILSSFSAYSLDANLEKVNFHKSCSEHKTFISKVITHGLDKIAHIRPSIKDDLNKMKPLSISCIEAPITSLFDKVARFYPEERKISLDHKFLLYDLKSIKNIGSEFVLSSTSSILLATPIFGNLVHNVIFHEFLHAIGLDNLSISEHNSLTGDEALSKDVIYACSQVVYPEGNGLKKMIENMTYVMNPISYSLSSMKKKIEICCDETIKKSCSERIHRLVDEFSENLGVMSRFEYEVRILKN